MLPSQAGPEVLIEAQISAGFSGSLRESLDGAATAYAAQGLPVRSIFWPGLKCASF